MSLSSLYDINRFLGFLQNLNSILFLWFFRGLSLVDIVALLMRPVMMADCGGKLPKLKDHFCALFEYYQQILCMSRVLRKNITLRQYNTRSHKLLLF